MGDNVNHDDYAKIPAANWSIIKLMDSPLKARWTMDNPGAGDTASRGMLRAVHCLALEPEVFERDFAVCTMRRDARTKAYQEFLAEHDGKTILSERDYSDAYRIAVAVRAHAVAGQILTSPTGTPEMTLTWTDSKTGIACKGRADWLDIETDGCVVITDLKTVRSVDNGDLGRMCARMGWLGQAAHYVDAARVLYPGRDVRFQLIAVESAEPHDVGVFMLDDAALNAGETIRRPLLDRFTECLASGDWPGRYQSAMWLDIPDYALPSIGIDDLDTDNL